MPLKPSRRLPKKFSRRISNETKRILSGRAKRKRRLEKEKWRKLARKLQHITTSIRVSLIRLIVVSVSVFMVFGIGMLLFSPILEVREIKVIRKDPRLDIENVQNILSPVFHKHILFLSGNEIRKLLMEKLVDAKKITVRKEYPSTLSVSINLEPLVARIYIQDPDEPEEINTSTGSSTDFLTENGIYVRAPLTDRTEVLPNIRLVDWGVRPISGTKLLDTEFLRALESAEVALVRQFGYEAQERVVFLRAQEFHIKLDRFSVWFDMKSPLGEQLQRFRIFLKSIDSDKVKEYVDLRIKDRVVYK